MVKTESPFVARINMMEETPPVRAYVHRAGFNEIFGGDAMNAALYFHDSYTKYLGDNLKEHDYAIAVMWGQTGQGKINAREKTNYRIIDVFGFKGIEPWPGNPDVSNWVMTNGIFTPLEKPTDITTCGDTLILLGKEESTRRECPNFPLYVGMPTSLEEMEPKKYIDFHDIARAIEQGRHFRIS
ncbi:MAG: hypothetical protein KKF39_01665 [Nanoarchaeota archaeon]|nr:hypothetical protein [Nanoarchaeota archaeon]